jgi:hypothetical protein
MRPQHQQGQHEDAAEDMDQQQETASPTAVSAISEAMETADDAASDVDVHMHDASTTAAEQSGQGSAAAAAAAAAAGARQRSDCPPGSDIASRLAVQDIDSFVELDRSDPEVAQRTLPSEKYMWWGEPVGSDADVVLPPNVMAQLRSGSGCGAWIRLDARRGLIAGCCALCNALQLSLYNALTFFSRYRPYLTAFHPPM